MNARKISQDEIEVLRDIETLCIFSSAKERRNFQRKVCALSNCTSYESVTKDYFTEVLNEAETFLRERGENIWRSKLKRRNKSETDTSRGHIAQADFLEDLDRVGDDHFSGGFY
jgi:hypothetical protein